MQIDLGTSYIVTGIEIAGRGDTNQMITKFNIKTSMNGIDWIDQGDYMGPYHHLTSVKRNMKRSVIASVVRITALEWINHPSMRVDILVHE